LPSKGAGGGALKRTGGKGFGKVERCRKRNGRETICILKGCIEDSRHMALGGAEGSGLGRKRSRKCLARRERRRGKKAGRGRGVSVNAER